jgi:hypothetical protein
MVRSCCLGQPQHLVCGSRRQRRAGGVVQHRHRDVQARPVFAQQGFHHRQVRAVDATRHRQQAHAQRVRRANSTAQPGSSTSTASPGCSSVRDTMSSACVAPTVVTTWSGVGAARRCRPAGATAPGAAPCAAGRVAIAQPGAARARWRGAARAAAARRPATPRAACPCRATVQPPRTWNMLRISAVASTGAAAAGLPPAAAAAAAGGARARRSRAVVAPRTRPLGLQQVVGADHGATGSPGGAAQSRTDGSRAPGASRRCSMRSAKRCASCSASVAPAAWRAGALTAGGGLMRVHRSVWRHAASTAPRETVCQVYWFCAVVP